MEDFVRLTGGAEGSFCCSKTESWTLADVIVLVGISSVGVGGRAGGGVEGEVEKSSLDHCSSPERDGEMTAVEGYRKCAYDIVLNRKYTGFLADHAHTNAHLHTYIHT